MDANWMESAMQPGSGERIAALEEKLAAARIL